MTEPRVTMVDFVENYFGVSADALLQDLSRHGAAIVPDPLDFLSLLEEQRPEGFAPELRAGELRPVVSHSISDIASGGIRLDADEVHAQDVNTSSSVALDVRSLLLYAHTVTIADPFASSIRLVGPAGTTSLVSERESAAQVRLGVEIICRLAPLIRGDVVFVGPPVEPPTLEDAARAEATLRELIPRVALKLVRGSFLAFSDQSDLFLRCRTIAERFLRQEDILQSMAPGNATRLIGSAAEAAALPDLDELRVGGVERTDLWALSELMRLRLQGAGRIRLADMVSIRDDDAFTIFRNDMASAVASSSTRTADGDAIDQANVIADEMRGAAERLHLVTRRSVVLSATLGDAVAWAVGAAIGGTVDGWRGAAIGIAASGATDLVRQGPSRSARAMRRHYVELSKPVESGTRESARDRLRRQRFQGDV
jgi:hypothetical protein